MTIRAGDDTTVYGTLALQGLPGRKGDPGDPGEPGADGGAGLVFNQSVSESTWAIVHNLDRYPQVTVLVGGEAVDAEVSYPDLNTVHVDFTVPTTGIALVN